MENYVIILQHSGEWDENRKYINFEVCGLLISNDCNYSNFVAMIYNELKLEPGSVGIRIEYQVRDGYPPFKIADDSQLMFYIELKKKESDFTKFPLCLTTEMKSIQPFSTTSNSLCFEVTQSEDVASNVDYEQSVGIVSDVVADYVDFAELVAGQIVLVDEVADTCVGENNLNKELVISNKKHTHVEVDQIYIDKETLKIVLGHYAINNNFQYYVQKSCKKEYVVACVDKSCKWMLRASKNGKTSCFIIRKLYDIHTCDLGIRFKDRRQASASLIANIIKSKFSNIKTKYTVADIIRDMNNDHKVQVNYGKAWRAKEKALELMRGNATKSYDELFPYLYMLHRSNPGSAVIIKQDEDSCFRYIFVALYASMKGWPNCIPIVIVDGTFLKSGHGGTLLVATTQDAGGRIFPLAFSVVDSENDLAWEWFFDKFMQAYGVREGMTIISDRHESIVKAVSKVYPEVPHGFCIFHLFSNMKSKFKKNSNKIKKNFFEAANAYTVKKFDYHMNQLAKIDSRVQPFLEQVGYDKWARVHSKNNRYSNLTSNNAESLNAVIISIRELPICTMLESLRALVQKWSWTNRKIANETSTKLTNKFEQILRNNYVYAANMTVNPSNSSVFEVCNVDKKSIVNLATKSCTCNRFQMDQLPCAHAIAVLQKVNHDIYDYCSSYYTKEAMIAAYKELVHPVGNKDTWNVPEDIKARPMYPPKGRIRTGRPKKRRRKAVWESNMPSQQFKCGKCGKYGHNRRTCRNPSSE